VSIDDHEVHNLRAAMNEVFGEENFIAQITVLNNPKGRVLGEHFALCHDYVLVYSRESLSKELVLTKSQSEVESQYPFEEGGRRYRLLELRNTHRQFNRKTRKNLFFPISIEIASGAVVVDALGPGVVEVLPIWDDGLDGCWTWGKDKVRREAHLLLAQNVNGKWKVFRKAFAEDESGIVASKKLQTIWTDRKFHTEVGQGELEELISGRVFEAPKPVGLIKLIAQIATESDEEQIVLDFFAGSGSTCHAVLDLNREDSGRRLFVAVQLPELTREGSPARDRGFHTIADIGKERIRRVIAKLKSENAGQLPLSSPARLEDPGFRVFKMAPSAFKPWGGEAVEPEAYARQLELQADPLVEGWKPQDVIWEVALREGYSLDARVKPVSGLEAWAIWRVTDEAREQSFVICLADRIDVAALRPLNLGKEDLFICRDAALSDEAAANLALQCRLKTI
jgi:adenine-specific DNA-methyltransferase